MDISVTVASQDNLVDLRQRSQSLSASQKDKLTNLKRELSEEFQEPQEDLF